MTKTMTRLVFGAFALVSLAACTGNPESMATQDDVKNAAGFGYNCKAGIYTCKLPVQAPLGSQCTCPALGAESYGVVR